MKLFCALLAVALAAPPDAILHNLTGDDNFSLKYYEDSTQTTFFLQYKNWMATSTCHLSKIFEDQSGILLSILSNNTPGNFVLHLYFIGETANFVLLNVGDKKVHHKEYFRFFCLNDKSLELLQEINEREEDMSETKATRDWQQKVKSMESTRHQINVTSSESEEKINEISTTVKPFQAQPLRRWTESSKEVLEFKRIRGEQRGPEVVEESIFRKSLVVEQEENHWNILMRQKKIDETTALNEQERRKHQEQHQKRLEEMRKKISEKREKQEHRFWTYGFILQVVGIILIVLFTLFRQTAKTHA
jgi:hypothetical protein